VKQKGHHSPGQNPLTGNGLLWRRFEDVYQQLLLLPELTIDDALHRTRNHHEHEEVSNVRGIQV